MADRLRKAVAIALFVFHPISPRHWPELARRLSIADGWVPPMMMIAALGAILPMNIGVGWLGNVPLMRTFNLVTWITWLIVGGIGTTIVAFQSLRNLFRLGMWGSIRPRWWFEIARLLWIVLLFSLLSIFIPFILDVAGIANGIIDATFILFLAVQYSYFGFFATATIGYILSFVRQWPRRGRAFECVHYFYVIVGGFRLLTFAAFRWPPQKVWPDGVVIGLLAVLGMAILTGGFISIIVRYEKNEKKHKQQIAT